MLITHYILKKIKNTIQLIGSIFIFFLNIVTNTPYKKVEFYQIILQLYYIGSQSVSIIILSSIFVGSVLAIQGNYILEMFGANDQLGQLVALSVLRELGPVITGLLFIGRAGSTITSEVGIMQLTDQIDALKSMRIDISRYILFPRFIAVFISMPLLTMLFNAFAVIGAYLISTYSLQLDSGLFLISIKSYVSFWDDVMTGLFKTLFFGTITATIALYYGINSNKSSTGVAQASTKTVVYSSIVLLLCDYILTSMLMRLW
ncbi:MAG: MlaE family lipid ABC transporter permease subunit [Pseudomonadota bacterium]|nr:MlaE family lipid ABC transporter permease subunit [Pseudomonadota bacterium]